MRCEFLKAHRGEFGPIRKACEILRVSRSEYYDYIKRGKSNAQIEREALEGFVAERFEAHKGRYGYRRINRELRKDGIVVSEKRVLNVMRKLGLQAKGATRKHRRARAVEAGDPRVNLVNRIFDVSVN
ncbi:IS3 family transposase [Adlercreutzia shanghongiae]|uniref:IS3 family transposase n=1 Tax=Adlercreutzia shanghongiae TaxID=3111773 RepID=A0ABU6J078_9ACTN|nr:IS3 family transposase [Adlercreutzia sp. R22]MEC4295549.1 IS3 family transposase [Adlercreutzia sp. R22]